MHSEAKKLHIIEEVLKMDSNAALSALERFLKKSKKDQYAKNEPGFNEFSGIWSKDEADEIEQVIIESCETIHPDDWK